MNQVKYNSLQDAFDAFNDLRILVIGDAMIDSYLWGDVERISPEAPVPVVSKTNRESRLGGAANVAINIKALGAKPILASVIGNDHNAQLFKTLMSDQQLPKNGIFESNTRSTTIKTRIVSHKQQLLRIDEENSEELDQSTEEAFLKHLLYIMDHDQLHAVVFEDYDKGTITPAIISQVTEKANEKGLPVLVDPKKRNYLNYRNVTLFKPNFKELKEGLKMDHFAAGDYEKIFSAMKVMHQEQQLKWIMVTLSEKGLMISNGQQYKHIPAKVRDISDVSGAGDTIISIAGVGLAAGLSPWVISEISNIGGGQVCERSGVVPVEKDKLLEESLEHISFLD